MNTLNCIACCIQQHINDCHCDFYWLAIDLNEVLTYIPKHRSSFYYVLISVASLLSFGSYRCRHRAQWSTSAIGYSLDPATYPRYRLTKANSGAHGRSRPSQYISGVHQHWPGLPSSVHDVLIDVWSWNELPCEVFLASAILCCQLFVYTV